MTFIKRLWWLFTDRTIEYDLPSDINPALVEKANFEPALSFRDAWELVNPHPLWRLAVRMPCGCDRLPWRRKPFAMTFDCLDHGNSTWGPS